MPPIRFRIRTVMIFIVVLALALGIHRLALWSPITRVSLEFGGPRVLVIHLSSPEYMTLHGSEAVDIPLSLVEIVLAVGPIVGLWIAFARLFRAEHQRRKLKSKFLGRTVCYRRKSIAARSGEAERV